MAPLSRFGASKYRNATLHIPAKEEWYRSNLPPTGSSGSTTSTFSSEVKTNREFVVTLAPSGDLSWRGYKSGDEVGKAKVGSGTVSDWSLGKLEGGALAVGGVDGTVSRDAVDPDIRYTSMLFPKLLQVVPCPFARYLALLLLGMSLSTRRPRIFCSSRHWRVH